MNVVLALKWKFNENSLKEMRSGFCRYKTEQNHFDKLEYTVPAILSMMLELL